MKRGFVVVVHGQILVPKLARMLADHLRTLGWKPLFLDYHPFHFDYAGFAREIDQALDHVVPGGLHLVGHGIGGVLLSRYCAENADKIPSEMKVVTLCSPHREVPSAAWYRLWSWLLGESALRDAARAISVTHWLSPAGLGTIGGIRGFGPISLAMRELGTLHDGVVANQATTLIGEDDHLDLPFSHLSLLMQAETALQVDHFLTVGRFSHKRLA